MCHPCINCQTSWRAFPFHLAVVTMASWTGRDGSQTPTAPSLSRSTGDQRTSFLYPVLVSIGFCGVLPHGFHWGHLDCPSLRKPWARQKIKGPPVLKQDLNDRLKQLVDRMQKGTETTMPEQYSKNWTNLWYCSMFSWKTEERMMWKRQSVQSRFLIKLWQMPFSSAHFCFQSQDNY